MVVQTKEACQEIYATAQISTISPVTGGLTLTDMEAVFGQLVRSNAYTGGDQNTVILESENQERLRVFNFTEIPITKIAQDGVRQIIAPVDPSEYVTAFTPSHTQGLKTPRWWSVLARTQSKPHDLVNKIVIAKSRFFLGKSIHEIKTQLRASRLSEEVFEKLLTSTPFTAYYGGKRIQAIYAMFMYIVDIQDFKGYLHLHERSSDVFVSICDPIKAPAHPWDVNNAIVDCRVVGEPNRLEGVPLITYRLVYHDYKPMKRFIKEGGSVVELIPQQDSTTEEGFYKHLYIPDTPEGVPGYAEYTFVALDKITEEAGFYTTREGAVQKRTELDLAAYRKQQRADQEQLLKAWIAAIQNDSKTAASHYKEYYGECLDTLRQGMNQYKSQIEQVSKEHAKDSRMQRELIDQLKEDLNDRKAEHERKMQGRKDFIEVIRIIPPIITVIASFIALSQKSKKK